MAKTLNDFTTKTTLSDTDNVIGFSSTTAGGEFKIASSNVQRSLKGAAKAWFTGSNRSANLGGLIDPPRILENFNIQSVDKIGANRFFVYFITPFNSRNYCVIGDASTNNNDKVWVAGWKWNEIPSEAPLVEANKLANNDKAYKSTTGCKFEASNAAYVTEFCIVFYGI